MKHPLLGCVLLASAGLAQVPSHSPSAAGTDPSRIATTGRWPCDGVLYDEPGDGNLWAMGASWKASFGRDGFVYRPYLRGARHELPLRFRVASLRVGGVALPVASDALPERTRDRVAFDRGALREIYDLGLQQVEQSFVVDAQRAGDVELELTITGALREDAAAPGLQFGCELGEVHYSDAVLVRGGQRFPIERHFAGETLHLRVPAALRGDGPVVIDPILSSQNAGSPDAVASPDVAYDASTDRHLVVWEVEFSENDHDVLSVLCDGTGAVIAGSGAAIDATTAFWTHPRAANRNASDMFLVVATAPDPSFNDRMMVFGRRREAAGTGVVHPIVRISSPTVAGDNFLPDVGGDPDPGATVADWIVVWANSQGSTTAGINARMVDGNGLPRAGNIFVQPPATGTRYWNPQVSKGNGRGNVASPMWLVAYDRTIGTTVDVRGRVVDPTGNPSPEIPIEVTSQADRLPHVSSPADLGAAGTGFLVVWERPTAARAKLLLFTVGTVPVTQPFDLTSSGLGRFTPRVDSDGARFLVSASNVDPFATQANQTEVVTLGWDGVTLAVQEGPTTLPGLVTEPQIAALRASGGRAGDYAIGHLLPNGFLKQPVLTRYAGVTAGAMTQVVPTACNGLQLTVAGTTALGGTLAFTLANFGSDIPILAFGSPAPAPLAICPPCAIGLRLDLPILPTIGAASAVVPIPPAAGLVGQSFAMQGLGAGLGSCLGAFTFSDTIVFTIR